MLAEIRTPAPRIEAGSKSVEDAYASGSYAWADVEKRASNGKQLEIGQIVGLVVGAVAAGGGATLLWLGYRGGERRASLFPSAGPGFAGLSGHIAF